MLPRRCWPTKDQQKGAAFLETKVACLLAQPLATAYPSARGLPGGAHVTATAHPLRGQRMLPSNLKCLTECCRRVCSTFLLHVLSWIVGCAWAATVCSREMGMVL